MITLDKYGWNNYTDTEVPLDTGKSYGRIITVHKTNYKVACISGIKSGELLGQLLFTSEPHNLPQTGDWVEIMDLEDHCIITNVLPRKTILTRKVAGRTSQIQVLATNIDIALIVQGLDRDFNINRLERMILALKDAQIEPVVLLNKIDISPDWHTKIEQVNNRLQNISIHAFSALNNTRIEAIKAIFKPQLTYVLMGTSGAGKSTLLNRLMNEDIQKTNNISEAIGKGKHTTTTRQLFPLENGSLIIDSPGVREFALALDNIESINLSFDEIEKLSITCKYKNCSHTSESGCAILEALQNGNLNKETYANYLKLRDEALYYNRSVLEKKRKGKQLAKLIKDMKNKNMKKRY